MCDPPELKVRDTPENNFDFREEEKSLRSHECNGDNWLYLPEGVGGPCEGNPTARGASKGALGTDNKQERCLRPKHPTARRQSTGRDARKEERRTTGGDNLNAYLGEYS